MYKEDWHRKTRLYVPGDRIEQVEKQNKMTAHSVADLTVDVRAIRRDVKQVNARLDNPEADVSILKQDVMILKQDVSELKQDVGTIKQTLQLVLAYLHEKLP